MASTTNAPREPDRRPAAALQAETASPAKEPSVLDLHIAPEMQRAEQCFRRDLPGLLRNQHGQWVAYCVDTGKPILFAPTKQKAYQRCISGGYQKHQLAVWCVIPGALDDEPLEMDKVTRV